MMAPESIARRLLLADGFRLQSDDRATHAVRTSAANKEWSHFVIFILTECGVRIDLLVNFSLTDGVQSALNCGRAIPRVTLLACVDSDWLGSVRRFDSKELDVRAGRIDARFADQFLVFRDNCYWLEVADETIGLRARLRLQPCVTPLMTPSAPMDGGSVRWLIAPRLTADGTVSVGERRWSVRAAPAYHDHNWGQFCWGGDFSWQWGVVLDRRSNAFAIVSRVLDAGGNRVLSESVVVGWAEQLREFRASEIAVVAAGRAPGALALRIPPVMNLVLADRCADVPGRIRIAAQSVRDETHIELMTSGFAQIGIPNDHHEAGISLLTEVRCTGSVRGCFGGESFDFCGPAIWEVTSSARA